MTLKDTIDILAKFDLVHDETVSLEQCKGTVDYQQRKIFIAKGLNTWDARKTVVHELEHVRRHLNNISNREALVSKEANRIIQDAYNIHGPARSLDCRSTDQEITEEILKFLLDHIKANDSIVCGSRRCKYHYGYGNHCYLKHIQLRNGICRYFDEGEFSGTRTDIPREIIFEKIEDS